MLNVIKSTAIRFVSPALLAEAIIARPSILGPNRAGALFNLAANGATSTRRSLGRRALQAAAKAAGRHVSPFATINDRVFNKASNARLAQWAQDRNSKV